MNRIILGLLIGIGLTFVGTVFAKDIVNSVSWYQVRKLDVSWGTITKSYDEDANVVCYTFSSGSAGSISCLKNK